MNVLNKNKIIIANNIPSGWKRKKIEDLIKEDVILEVLDGNHGDKHPKASDYVEDGIPFIMASDISNGKLDLKNCRYISENISESLAKGFALEGDVLLTHKGTVGQTAIVPELKTQYVVLTPQVTYYRLKKDNITLNRDYLRHYFNSESFQVNLKSIGAQSTRDYVGITEQKKLYIILPTIEEQQKISEILLTWDSAIEKQEQLIENKKNFKKGLDRILFSRGTKSKELINTTQGLVSDNWNETKMSDIIEEVNISDNNDDIPLYSLTIEEGLIPKPERYDREFLVKDIDEGYKVIEKECFVYNPMNLRFGAIAKMKDNVKARVSKYYNVFQCKNNVNNDFLENFLKSERIINYYNRMAIGSLEEKKRVHFSQFINFKFYLPSLEEQNKIAKILLLADKEIELLQKELEAIKLQKKGLMQRLLTGEVRVKV